MGALEGKVAVVLGASAEGGTGWAIAERLAADGAKVVVAARRKEPLEELARRIGGLAVVCDAGKPEEIAALANAAVDAYGGIDIGVMSAARPVVGNIADTSMAAVQKSLDVNYIGHVAFLQELGKFMNDNGSFILISSLSATRPVQGFFPYACAKAATDALVRYAALEFGPRGIRVNSILPGPIKTVMGAHLYEAPGSEEAFAREIPLGRVGQPEDFAHITAMLAGDHYMTGLNIEACGGINLNRVPRADELPGGEGSYNNTID